MKATTTANATVVLRGYVFIFHIFSVLPPKISEIKGKRAHLYWIIATSETVWRVL